MVIGEAFELGEEGAFVVWASEPDEGCDPGAGVGAEEEGVGVEVEESWGDAFFEGGAGASVVVLVVVGVSGVVWGDGVEVVGDDRIDPWADEEGDEESRLGFGPIEGRAGVVEDGESASD